MKKKLIITPDKLSDFIEACQMTDNISHYDPYYDEAAALMQDNPSTIHSSLMICHDKYFSEVALCLNGKISAFASDFSYYNEASESIHEIYVLTAPEYRRLGLGKELVNLILMHIEEPTAPFSDIPDNSNAVISECCRQRIFLVGSCDGFAKSLGAVYSHSEHFMKLTQLKDTHNCGDAANYSDTAFKIEHSSNKSSHALRLFASEKSVCRCHIDIFSDSLYISKVYTNKAERGHGYAGQLIKKIHQLYPNKPLLLQVSGNNKSALKCYLKAGFTFYETTDYYEINL